MAVIIGKAAIKVYPDTKRFREETLAKLKKELAGLDKDVNEQQRLQVKAEVVVDKQKSAKNFKAFMDKLNDQVVKVTVDVDVSDKLADINKQVEDAINGAESNPKVTPEVDTSKFEKDIDAAAERMESELTEAFEGALDGDRVRAWSDRFNKELSKVRREISRSLEGITDLGSMNSINSAGQQMLNNAKQMEQALRNEEMARRRLAKLMNAKKQDADAILAAERKVLEATEAREAAERAAGLSRDKLAKAHIDGIERSRKAEMSAAESRMRAMEAEFAKVMDETNKASDAAADSAQKATRTLEDVGNQAYWAQAQIGEMFEADQEWMREAERGAYALRDRGRYWTEATENLKHNFREAARGAKALNDAILAPSRRTDFEVGIDQTAVERGLAVIRQRLQEIKDDFDDTDLEFHPVLDESSYRGVWARIKWLTRDRIAMIHPIVNKGAAALAERTLKAITLNASGLRNAGRALKNFFEYLERLDKNAPVLGLIATGIAAISGAALAAVGTISHLIVEFTRMAGAGLALPGILGGFAVGIGVMVAAMQDFNEEVPKIRKDLGRMQDSLSQKFWQQARVPLLDAWNKILPSLEEGFDRTAVSLGNWTAAMADGLSSNLSTESMSYMFENLAESIDIAAESGDDFGRIIEVLGKRGSEYLPRLAQWGNDVMASFRGWLDEADRTGALNDMIETGITKLKEFGVLVRESGELIYILGSAAERAGFSGLKEMSEGLEQVNEDLKRNQDSLDDYFEGAAKMADGFKSALGSIMDGIGEFSGTFKHISGDVQSVFEDIGDAMETVLGDKQFQQGVEDLFGGLSSAIEDITGAAPELAAVLGAVASTAGTVLENIGEIGGKFIEAFGPEITQLLTALKVPIDNLGTSVGNLIDALANEDGDFSLFTTLTSLVAAGLDIGINNLSDAIQGLADAIEALNDIMDEGLSFDSIGDLFSGLARMIGGALSNSPAFMGFNFVNWILKAMGLEVEWRGLKGVQDRFTQIKVELKFLWQDFKDSLSDLFTSDPGAQQFSILDAVKKMLGIESVSFDTLFTWAKTELRFAWQDFKTWLSGLFTIDGGSEFDLGDAVKDLLGIEDVDFSTLFDGPKEKLSEAWDGFTGGLGELFGGGGAAGSLADGWDLDFRLNATDNATPVVDDAGWNMFEWANEKYEAILDAYDDTAGPVESARSGIMQWATDTYEAMLEAVNDTSSGIGSARGAIERWMGRDYKADLEATNRTGSGIDSARRSINSRIVDATFRASVTMNPHVSGLAGVVARIRRAVANFTANIRAMMPFANGGTTRPGPPALREADGGVLKFANGGITNGIANGIDRRIRYATEHHVAQIAPAGAMRLWAEPETGGEAYIPLSPAKRARSTAILSDVADRFGYKLQQFNNGSEPSRGGDTSYGGNNYTVNVQTLRPDVAQEVTGDVMFHLKHLAYGGGRQHGF